MDYLRLQRNFSSWILAVSLLALPAGTQTITHLVTVHEAAGPAIEITAVNSLDTYDNSATTTAIDLDFTGAAEGSLLYAVLDIEGTNSVSSVPSGWSLVCEHDDGGAAAPYVLVYEKVAAASETSYTWNTSLARDAAGAAIEIVGGKTCIHYYDDGAEDLNKIYVPEGGIALAIAGGNGTSGDTTQFNPSNGSYTEVADTGASGSGEDASVAVAWLDQDGPTTASDDYDDISGNQNETTIHMSILPAGGWEEEIGATQNSAPVIADGGASETYWAGGFQLSTESGQIDAIVFYEAREGNSDDSGAQTFDFQIWDESGGEPNAAVSGGTFDDVEFSYVTNGYDFNGMVFWSGQPSLSSSTQYYAVFKDDAPLDTNHISVRRQTTGTDPSFYGDGTPTWTSDDASQTLYAIVYGRD